MQTVSVESLPDLLAGAFGLPVREPALGVGSFLTFTLGAERDGFYLWAYQCAWRLVALLGTFDLKCHQAAIW